MRSGTKSSGSRSRRKPNVLRWRGIDEDQFRRLVASIPDTAIGRRNRAMLEVMFSAGLRTQETCDLQPADFDSADLSLEVRHGKGDRPRWVPINEDLAARLDAWIAEPSRPDGPGVPLFPVMSGAGRGTAIAPRQVRKMVERLACRAGVFRTDRVSGRQVPISPHVLRHAYAQRMLRKGLHIAELQRLLGHSSIQTTRIYLEGSDEELARRTRRALDGHHVDSQVDAERVAAAELRLAGGVADDAGSTMDRLLREELSRRPADQLVEALRFLDEREP